MKTCTRLVLLAAFSILNSEFCIQVFANDLSVDRRTVRAGETVTITVSLEDAFATIDDVVVPVHNLALDPTPSVSSEYSWINGTVVRRKVFRFAAIATAAGPATVGPLVITLPDGERETFPRVVLQILPDRAAGSNDPVAVLRELLATGREPFFVVAEADKTQAYVGEEVVVTWWLYNAASVQEWQIGSVPPLAEFWTEEVDVRSARPDDSYVGAYVMQRMPIRRVALFPLHGGTLPIGSMEVQAAVMRRSSGRPFALWEGNLVDVSFSSAPLAINVLPLPAGAAGVLVGDLSLNCSKPRQKNGGPVLVNVTLAGRGNVRSAPAPQFASAPPADVQVIERGTLLDRSPLTPSMTRRWQYLLFPARSGSLAIPAMTLPVFSPSTGSTRLLRCEASTLTVSAAGRETASQTPVSPAAGGPNLARIATLAMSAIVIALIVTVLGSIAKRRRSASTRIRQLVADRSPAEIREAVHERLTESGIDVMLLLYESSDRGEAYRALRSLLDSLEHERIASDASEVRRRVRELLDSLQSAA